jgi:hypothetical protein
MYPNIPDDKLRLFVKKIPPSETNMHLKKSFSMIAGEQVYVKKGKNKGRKNVKNAIVTFQTQRGFERFWAYCKQPGSSLSVKTMMTEAQRVEHNKLENKKKVVFTIDSTGFVGSNGLRSRARPTDGIELASELFMVLKKIGKVKRVNDLRFSKNKNRGCLLAAFDSEQGASTFLAQSRVLRLPSGAQLRAHKFQQTANSNAKDYKRQLGPKFQDRPEIEYQTEREYHSRVPFIQAHNSQIPLRQLGNTPQSKISNFADDQALDNACTRKDKGPLIQETIPITGDNSNFGAMRNTQERLRAQGDTNAAGLNVRIREGCFQRRRFSFFPTLNVREVVRDLPTFHLGDPDYLRFNRKQDFSLLRQAKKGSAAKLQ